MILGLMAATLLFSDVICENGVCRLVPDEPAGPSTMLVREDAHESIVPPPARVAQGLMSETEFLEFLSGETKSQEEDLSLGWILILAIVGGLALNLTPCVLPLIPVNLLVIGASPLRGLLYGLGQMTMFGTLGLLAARGGVAFGTIQSSPWFNGGLALVFLFFALALVGAFSLDFGRFRKKLKGGAFVLGAVSALFAGACVAPVLASVLLLTARLYAEGRTIALILPFAVGAGLALPWPFLGGGLKILPKPGAWMRWVNRLFALFIVALAFHSAWLAIQGLHASPKDAVSDLTLAEFRRMEFPSRTRPLLVFCHAAWCKNCPAMERLLARSARIQAALENVDVVRLNADDPNELRRLPGCSAVQGLPAFLLYDGKINENSRQ